MRFSPRPWSVLILGGIALGVLTPAGCGPGVRQDRTIAWSPGGKAVGFQHNDEGVFLADEDGEGLQRIFQPGPDVIATSPPRWHPHGDGVIFTTARDPSQPAGANPPVPFTRNPEGEVYRQRPVIYTCWRWQKPADGQPSQPEPLFEAGCGHPGYVAADLAVRWDPKGERVLYVKDTGGGRHGLFAYDFKAKSSRQVFPHTAEALTFEPVPGGGLLACVLADSKPNNAGAGIWIGKPGDPSWWQVPGSGTFGDDPAVALLDQAWARQPVWTADGARFAFATFQPGTGQKETGQSRLQIGTPVSRRVETWAEGTEPFRDLHWAADGKRLGLIRGRPVGSLYIVRGKGDLPAPLNRRPVRHFAGWNARGDRLAYVVPSRVYAPDPNAWAFLLTPDPMPRDAVLIAPGAGADPGQEVFAGMRVTFPRWAPKEDKLSVWFTFSPTHRSLPARLLETGVPRGDPAAVFDPATGAIKWLAVNGGEKAQIGHYHLLRREYQVAWDWYRQAEAEPLRPRATPSETQALTIVSRQDFSFFTYYCLTRLGKPEEAKTRLKSFRKAFDQAFSPGGPAAPPATALDQFWITLLRDLYAAEVFLGVDAAEEGRRFFHETLKTAPTDAERLSGAIVLAQLLLLDKKHAEYADLVTDTIRPLIAKVGWPGAAGQNPPNAAAQFVLGEWAWLPFDLTLLPLCCPEFLATLRATQVQALIARWDDPPAPAGDNDSRLMADLFLEAAFNQVAKKADGEAAGTRARANPALTRFAPNGVAERVKNARELPAQLDALREVLELIAGR